MKKKLESGKPVPYVLIADTTNIFSAIAYNGLEREILRSNKFTFLITKDVFDELYRLLITKLELSGGRALYVLKRIPVAVKNRELYKDKMTEANKLMGFRDASDAPTVALTLAVRNDGIWSSDKDFGVLKNIKVWRSRELLNFVRREQKLKYINNI